MSVDLVTHPEYVQQRHDALVAIYVVIQISYFSVFLSPVAFTTQVVGLAIDEDDASRR